MTALVLKTLLATVAVLALLLLIWRISDVLRVNRAWAELLEAGPASSASFDPAMVSDLPEPARRYFAFTIAPGTPLASRAILTMEGQIGMGDKADPNYQDMRARQLLHPPHGLVWRVTTGALSGSDGALVDRSWTRFWLFHLLPVVRVSGDDHLRSAFGRVVSEAPMWAPASLLPSETVTWRARGPDTARATLTNGRFTQWVDITVREDGAPVGVVIERWSDANADRTYRLQPFGGTLSEYATFGGFTLPTRVEGGNLIGTDDYFPFFKARVTAVEFR